MTIKTLLQRKFRSRLSDQQMLILIELGARGRMRFIELVNETGGSAGGIGNQLARVPLVDYVAKVKVGQASYYELTSEGRQAVAGLMRSDTPPVKPGLLMKIRGFLIP